jgi:hypothetical protein
MLWPKKDVIVAANGRLMVSWPDADQTFYAQLLDWLRLNYGLRESGEAVASFEVVILPDLVGEGVRLEAGWDIWCGYHLVATDEAGDDFLRRTLAPGD